MAVAEFAEGASGEEVRMVVGVQPTGAAGTAMAVEATGVPEADGVTAEVSGTTGEDMTG